MTTARDTGLVLAPNFEGGLMTAVCTDAHSGDVLMVAHMNADALAASLASGKATFWSRSRERLWVKGETSGNFLNIVEMRIDCDQDAVWLKCIPDGPVCHTGEASCFFRRIDGGQLIRDE